MPEQVRTDFHGKRKEAETWKQGVSQDEGTAQRNACYACGCTMERLVIKVLEVENTGDRHSVSDRDDARWLRK